MSTPVYFHPNKVVTPDIEMKKAAVAKELNMALFEVTAVQLKEWDTYQCSNEKEYRVFRNYGTDSPSEPSSVCSRPPDFSERLSNIVGVSDPSVGQKRRVVAGASLLVTSVALFAVGFSLFGVGHHRIKNIDNPSGHPDYYRDFNIRTAGGSLIGGGILTGLTGFGLFVTLPLGN